MALVRLNNASITNKKVVGSGLADELNVDFTLASPFKNAKFTGNAGADQITLQLGRSLDAKTLAKLQKFKANIESGKSASFKFDGFTIKVAKDASPSKLTVLVLDKELNVQTGLLGDVVPPTGGPNNPPPSQTNAKTLTINTDVIEPTATNDTITGVVSTVASQNTFSAADQIDGGLGTDTLVLNLLSNFIPPSTTTGFVRNIENLVLTGNNGLLFDAKGIDGLRSVTLNQGATPVGILNLAYTNGLSIDVNNQRNSPLNVMFTPSSVVGANDTLTLKLNNSALTSATLAGIETLSLESSGAPNAIGLSNSSLQQLNIRGASNLEVTNVNSSLQSINAANATGALAINASLANKLQNIVLGNKDDVLTAQTSALSDANATVNGGSGKDTLVLMTSNGTNLLRASLQNFETLELKSASGSIELNGESIQGLENLLINNTGNDARITLTNFVELPRLTLDAGTNISSLFVRSPSVLNIETQNTGTVGQVSITDFTTFDVSQLNYFIDRDTSLTSQISFTNATSMQVNALNHSAALASSLINVSAATQLNSLAINSDQNLFMSFNDGAASLSQITVTGGRPLSNFVSLNGLGSSSTTGISIDASSYLGAFNASGQANNVSVLGSQLSNNSIDFFGNTTTASISTGAGNDSVFLVGDSLSNVSLNLGTGSDFVSLFTGASSLNGSIAVGAGFISPVNVSMSFNGNTLNLSALSVSINQSQFVSVSGNNLANVITGTSKNDVIQAGRGADIINLNAGGNDTIRQFTGDSGSFTSFTESGGFFGFGTTFSVNAAAFDVVNGANADDILFLDTLVDYVQLRKNVGERTDNGVSYFYGDYNSSTKIFTVNANGQSTLVTYDTNAGTGAENREHEAIVLVGFAGDLSLDGNTLTLV